MIFICVLVVQYFQTFLKIKGSRKKKWLSGDFNNFFAFITSCYGFLMDSCCILLQNTTEEFQKKILKERIARLSGSIAILQVNFTFLTLASWQLRVLESNSLFSGSYFINLMIGWCTNSRRAKGQTTES